MRSKRQKRSKKHRRAHTANHRTLSADRAAVRREPSAVERETTAVRREPSGVHQEPAAVLREPGAVRRETPATRGKPRYFRFRVPLGAMLDDAAVVARFVREHWETMRAPDGTILKRGLDSVGHPLLGPGTADELERMIVEAQRAQIAWAARPKRPTMKRTCSTALARIRALSRMCRTWASMTGSSEVAAFAKKLNAAHGASRARESLAAALEDWTRLARELPLDGWLEPKAFDHDDALVAELRRPIAVRASEALRVERDSCLRSIAATADAVRAAARLLFDRNVLAPSRRTRRRGHAMNSIPLAQRSSAASSRE